MIKKDNLLMALLSVWGILLVVLGHSGFQEPIIQEKLSYLYSWIYSFHMPLFFMISGYLFSLTNKSFVDINLGKFMWKKVLRLLVPYVVIGTIVFGIKYVFSGFSHATRVFSVGGFFKMFLAPSCENSTIGYLWYIVTLFVVFAVVVSVGKLGINLKKTWVCSLAIVFLWVVDVWAPKTMWLNEGQVVHYLPYFLLGILLFNYNDKVLKLINGGGYINILIFIILSVVLTIFPLDMPSGLSYPIRSLIGLWLSLSVCQMMLKSDSIKNFLMPLGDKTYCIYLLHWFGQYAAKVIIVDILHLHWSVCVLGMFICGLAIPLIVCLIVDRIKPLRESKALRLIIGY